MIDRILRQWIVQVIQQHESMLRIAIRQRAKFEGWLKFELAAVAEINGATVVEVETPSIQSQSKRRADISFVYQDKKYDVELKTPNANWCMAGVKDAHRPITKNIFGIIQDTLKLRISSNNGLVAFVLFPVAPGDNQWKGYIKRIAAETQLPITTESHCERISISLDTSDKVDLIVCVFSV